MYYIITSGKLNWSGKEFSNFPAKVYTCFQNAAEAIQNYHLIDINGNPVPSSKPITFKPISPVELPKLLNAEKVRW